MVHILFARIAWQSPTARGGQLEICIVHSQTRMRFLGLNFFRRGGPESDDNLGSSWMMRWVVGTDAGC
jgi:hypothetical protein